MPTLQHYLRVLELSGSVTVSDVRRSYRRLAKKWHPDRFASKSDVNATRQATERLTEINEAYRAVHEHLERGGTGTTGAEASAEPGAAHAASQPDYHSPCPWGTDFKTGDRAKIVQIREDDDYYKRREFLVGGIVVITSPIDKGNGWYCVHVAFESGSRQLAIYAEGALFARVRLGHMPKAPETSVKKGD